MDEKGKKRNPIWVASGVLTGMAGQVMERAVHVTKKNVHVTVTCCIKVPHVMRVSGSRGAGKLTSWTTCGDKWWNDFLAPWTAVRLTSHRPLLMSLFPFLGLEGGNGLFRGTADDRG